MDYDASNRIRKVTDGSNQVVGEYYYDDQGFRVRKVSRRTVAGEDRQIEVLYPSMYFGIEKQYTTGGTEIEESHCAVNNVYLNGVRVAVVAPSGQALYYLTDQVDSVKVVVNDSGLPIKRFEYLPYGETWFEEGEGSHAPKYNSQELDLETGYYFYNARHYDPEISRFVTADNVIDGEYDTQGWNRYSYTKGNPIRYKDPTGHNSVILQARTGADFVGGATGDKLNEPAGHTGVLQEYEDDEGNSKWMYFSRNQKLAEDGSLKAGSYNVHCESFDSPEDFFRRQSELVDERNEIERRLAKGDDVDKKRYDYLENYTYYDKNKKEARVRYDEGIEISTTPDEDKELYDYFELNQDAPYRLVGTNNLSWKQRGAILYGTMGLGLWPILYGAITDSNNCKDLVRRGLEENTKYRSDDSLKPNNWYDDFKEKYNNDIVKEYHAEDY